MSYENPEVPHEVNVARDHPVGEFLRLLAGLGVCVLALSVLLYLCGGWLARQLPFSLEQRWVGERIVGLGALGEPDDDAPLTAYLERLVHSLAATMQLPADMTLHVHLSGSDVPNAFATLGGHIVVTRGLYRRMPSENALALVLAHEIAHLRGRDPIAAAGSGAALSVGLLLLGADAEKIAPAMAGLVQMGYSRRTESLADETALQAVRAVYGHAGGTAAVFEVLADYQAQFGIAVPTLLSTHPADAARIAALREASVDWDATRQPLLPLAVADKK